MERKINGKLIKITRAGYLYINGVKQSERIVTPTANLNDITTDTDALELCHQYTAKYYTLAYIQAHKVK